MTLEDQVRELRRLRRIKEILDRRAKEAKDRFDRAHRELWERMEATGVTAIGIDDRKFVWNKPKVYGSISDKAAFVAWAEEHAPELIEPDPRMALVNELVRERIDNNEPLPPGVNWFTRESVSDRAG